MVIHVSLIMGQIDLFKNLYLIGILMPYNSKLLVTGSYNCLIRIIIYLEAYNCVQTNDYH